MVIDNQKTKKKKKPPGTAAAEAGDSIWDCFGDPPPRKAKVKKNEDKPAKSVGVVPPRNTHVKKNEVKRKKPAQTVAAHGRHMAAQGFTGVYRAAQAAKHSGH